MVALHCDSWWLFWRRAWVSVSFWWRRRIWQRRRRRGLCGSEGNFTGCAIGRLTIKNDNASNEHWATGNDDLSAADFDWLRLGHGIDIWRDDDVTTGATTTRRLACRWHDNDTRAQTRNKYRDRETTLIDALRVDRGPLFGSITEIRHTVSQSVRRWDVNY